MITDSLQKLLLFIPVALLIYYPLPHRWQNLWLLIISYVFYVTWSWQQALMLFGITVFNYVYAQYVKTRERSGGLPVAMGVWVNIAVLAVLKYQIIAWGVSTFRIAGQNSPEMLAVLLPIGLSFLILQAISYLIDVSNQRIEASGDFVSFALYFAYFPKALAGPIERARSFLPQTAAPRVVDNERFAKGGTLLGIGIVRKILFADMISRTLPSDLFTTPANFGGLELAGYLIAYSFVIYNDFAGYTSIARGISCLFGIDLAPNFQRPYFASTFTEFWNRWHMSFSFWLRDYIYFPLSRWLAKLIPNRKHPIHVVVPPLVAMLLSGLWHAASPNMLLWGGLHGIFLMIRQIPVPGRKPVPPPQQPIWYRTTGAVLTFCAVTLAWVPFRMDLSTALEYYQSMFSHPLTGVLPVGSLLLIIPPLLFDWLQAAQEEDAPLRWPQLARSSALALVILLIMLMFLQVADVTTFVYQEF